MSARLALAPFALALAACAGATWRAPRAGEPLRQDEIVVVGSVTAVPPFAQYGPHQTNAVLLGQVRGNMLALIAPDLSERWDPSPRARPLSRAETALLPLRGHFFFVAPRAGTIYLRGVVYQTDTGGERYEAPLRIELAPADRVVYIGEVKLVRTGERRVLVRDDRAAARTATRDAGLAQLLELPWTTRLAQP